MPTARHRQIRDDVEDDLLVIETVSWGNEILCSRTPWLLPAVAASEPFTAIQRSSWAQALYLVRVLCGPTTRPAKRCRRFLLKRHAVSSSVVAIPSPRVGVEPPRRGPHPGRRGPVDPRLGGELDDGEVRGRCRWGWRVRAQSRSCCLGRAPLWCWAVSRTRCSCRRRGRRWASAPQYQVQQHRAGRRQVTRLSRNSTTSHS